MGNANIVLGPYSTKSIIIICVYVISANQTTCFTKFTMLKMKGLLRVIDFTQGKTDGETDEYIGKQRRSLSTSIRT